MKWVVMAAAIWTGGYHAGDVDALETRNPSTGALPLTLFHANSRVRPSPGGAVHLTVFLTSRLGIEAFADLSRPVLRTTFSNDFENAAGESAEQTAASIVAGGSLLYRLFDRKVSPYVVGGAGGVHQLLDESSEAITGLEVHGGGGIDAQLGSRVGLRADAMLSSRNKVVGFDVKRRMLPVIRAGLTWRF